MAYANPVPLAFHGDRLAGKVVFITGASSGIGAAAARRFAKEGATVVAAARRKPKVDALVEDLRDHGYQAAAVECDVTDEGSVSTAIDSTIESFGRIDAAFNNAGEGGAHLPLHEIPAARFDSIVATNVRGTFLCIKYQAPHMMRAGGGAIVVTSSIAGLVGRARNADYAASKWALTGLVKCAALDYAPHHIRINAIAPGPTRSEMFDQWMHTEELRAAMAARAPLNYIADPDDMARVALFLLSDEARWTTGCVLPCEGGMSVGGGPEPPQATPTSPS